MKLSEHFTLEEIEHSDKAVEYNIQNKIPIENIPVWKKACEELLEPIRNYIKVPLNLTSGYRGDKKLILNEKGKYVSLNEFVGGSINSSHRGYSSFNGKIYLTAAFDCWVDMKHGGNKYLYEVCIDLMKKGIILPDQIIWEYDSTKYIGHPRWVHLGFITGMKPRKQILRY